MLTTSSSWRPRRNRRTTLVTWTDALVHQNDRPIGTAGERPIFIALNGVAAEAMAHRYFDGSTGPSGRRPSISHPGSDHSQHSAIRDAPYRPRAGNR